MVRLPVDIPFDDWLDYLFGCPVGPSGFRESEDWWDEQADPALAVRFLTRLFEGPEMLLGRYPEDQIRQGLWFLASESGHLGPLLASPVPWEARRRGLLAIGRLYERLFAPVCTDHLGHLDRGSEQPHPLNAICYMWWDLFPTWGGRGGEQPQQPAPRSRARRDRRRLRREARTDQAGLHTVDDTILFVMARTLSLESEPCREGALHGLGHWHRAYPRRTTEIIDAWLAGQPRISSELRQYAMSARGGCVL